MTLSDRRRRRPCYLRYVVYDYHTGHEDDPPLDLTFDEPLCKCLNWTLVRAGDANNILLFLVLTLKKLSCLSSYDSTIALRVSSRCDRPVISHMMPYHVISHHLMSSVSSVHCGETWLCQSRCMLYIIPHHSKTTGSGPATGHSLLLSLSAYVPQ